MYESPVPVDPDADVWESLVAEWAAEDATGDVDPDGSVAAILAAGPGPWAAVALAEVDPAALSDQGRLDLLAAWQAQVCWAESQLAETLLVHAGTGREPQELGNEDAVYRQRSLLHEVGLALNLSPTAVDGRFDVACTLAERLPRTRRALAEGRLSWLHARLVAEVVAGTDDEVAQAVDERAATRGPGLTASRLKQSCRRLADRLDPAAAERRLARAHRTRRVERHGSGDDACLALWGDPRDVQAMWRSLTRLAGPHEADDPRTLGNRRFDAALGLMLAATSPSVDAEVDADRTGRRRRRRNPPVEVQVVVDLATLAGLADHPGELLGHGPVPAGTVRDWLTDATVWRRLVTDPVTGHLLDYGPRVRFAPSLLRSFVTTRDRRCTFPGCAIPAERCDVDHHPPWRPDGTGGSTSATDTAALCEQHHLWKTHYGWRLARGPDGRSRWTSPTGRTYDVLRRPILGED